jgi:hypothetical protein
MQIPILNGIYTDENSDFRSAYPRNLVPVPKRQGISDGYLRPAEGVVQIGSGPGIDRGAINWNGVCYRVMGTKLVSVASDGTTTTLGDVGGSGQVTMDYSFDYLAIASGGNLFYWDGYTLTQVTDADLGTVVDFVWVDGYFMTTDGEFLVVTELNDPFSVNPLKYGSSEADPDPVKAIIKVRNEPVAVNRYTMEMFDNVGGSVFPFQRIDGAQIQKGSIGTHSLTCYMDAIAFLGSGRNEAPAVWLGVNGNVTKISTREIDQLLLGYTEQQLATVVFEHHSEAGLNHLYIRLPDQTLVFDGVASQAMGQSVWFTLTSSLQGKGQHRVSNRTWCYDKWIVGDPQSNAIGVQSDEVSSHWGQEVGWEFSTQILYNEGRGAIIHDLELIALTGRAAFGDDPVIWTQYSLDGGTWSMEKSIKAGKSGERMKRLLWLQQGTLKNFRIQKFRGTSKSRLSFARLEARIEPMVW